MITKMVSFLRSLSEAFKRTFHQFHKLSAYEIKCVTTCPKTSKHLIEVKIMGKSQSLVCLAEEISADDSFIMRFSPADIRAITYLAMSDRYETILEEEKIKRSYELIRSRDVKGTKTIKIKHKMTGEVSVISLQNFNDSKLIDNLEAHDAYYLGFLAGQEQTWKDCVRVKLIQSDKSEMEIPHE
jgi:hypothetical protein